MEDSFRRLEDIDISKYNIRQEQYAVIYPITVMPRESVYSVYLEAQKRAMQAGIAFLSGGVSKRLVVRQLRPQDLGLPGPEWMFQVRSGRNTLLRYRVRDDQAIVIFGFYNQSPSPKVVQLEVLRGGVRRLIIVMQELYTRGYDPMGVLADFEVFRPGDEVELVGHAIGEGEEILGVMGYVAEPEGRLNRAGL